MILWKIEAGKYFPKGPSVQTIATIHYGTNGVVSIEDLCDREYYKKRYLETYPKLFKEIEKEREKGRIKKRKIREAKRAMRATTKRGKSKGEEDAKLS